MFGSSNAGLHQYVTDVKEETHMDLFSEIVRMIKSMSKETYSDLLDKTKTGQ